MKDWAAECTGKAYIMLPMRDSSTSKLGCVRLFGLILAVSCQPHVVELRGDGGDVHGVDVGVNTTGCTTAGTLADTVAVDIAFGEGQKAAANVVKHHNPDTADAISTAAPTATESPEHEIVAHPTATEQQADEKRGVGFAQLKESSESYARGIGFAMAGRYANSEEQLRKALDLNPFNHGAASGLEMVNAVSSGRVRPEAAAHMFRGVGYARDGRLDRAIRAWKKAAELDPSYAPAQTNLGTAYLGKGMMVEAAQCLRKAFEIDPNDGAAHNNMGLYWVNRGEWDKALAEFERAVALKPTPGVVCMALNNAGLTYEKKGLPDAALAMFLNVLAVNPNDSEAHYNLACHYYHEGEFELAISHCDKAERLGRKPHPNLVERLRPYRRSEKSDAHSP